MNPKQKQHVGYGLLSQALLIPVVFIVGAERGSMEIALAVTLLLAGIVGFVLCYFNDEVNLPFEEQTIGYTVIAIASVLVTLIVLATVMAALGYNVVKGAFDGNRVDQLILASEFAPGLIIIAMVIGHHALVRMRTRTA